MALHESRGWLYREFNTYANFPSFYTERKNDTGKATATATAVRLESDVKGSE